MSSGCIYALYAPLAIVRGHVRDRAWFMRLYGEIIPEQEQEPDKLYR